MMKSQDTKGRKQLRVAFLHPDLGIGGAERLVVDAALGLKQRGHYVHMYTSHHDKAHAFDETVDGTLPVTVFGDFLPRHLFGLFFIFFAILRSVYAALRVIVGRGKYDVIFIDQLSVSIPLFRLAGWKVFFYCHHPDMVLSERKTFLKRMYRIPFDLLEEHTTRLSHLVAVNSQYTKSVYERTFRSITAAPVVLYPSINFEQYESNDLSDPFVDSIGANVVILSINRFERKKNVELAVHALRAIRDRQIDVLQSVCLVLAGGYDPRVHENVQYFAELESLVEKHKLTAHVKFLPSFSSAQRSALLQRCRFLVYTPENEHFGIVPVEAMYARRPVVACNSGGPLESILNGKTGFVCDPTPEAFSDVFATLIRNPGLAETIGEYGREHVLKLFSLESFSLQLEGYLHAVVRNMGSIKDQKLE